MFTKEELIKKGIWGHSSIEQGIDFFNKCNIKNMLFSHHDPSRTDDQLNHFSKELTKGNAICQRWFESRLYIIKNHI